MLPELEEGKSLSLRVDLKYEIASTLLNIMEKRKFQSYAEAVRYCIIETNTSDDFKLEEEFLKKIQKYLSYHYVKHKERVFGIQDFIKAAVNHYIDRIEKKTESILSFDVRSELNSEELDVAMALIDCQEESNAEHVKVEQLAEKLGRRNLNKLRKTLDEFVERGILDKLYHKGTAYYHAKSIDQFD